MDNIKYSKEISSGEFQDLYTFLVKDLKLFKRKYFIILKYIKTNESLKYGIRYFEMNYQKEILELFNKNEFHKILSLPTGEFGRCATQLECRYTKSGSVVGFQFNEARPHEDGRYVGLTPAKVFFNSEGKKWVEYANKVDQKS